MNAVTNLAQIDPEALFRQYGPMVLRRCRQLLGDADEAADAAQDVFMKLLEGGDSLRGDYPSSLLWRMATNHCLNRLRDRKRHGLNGEGEALLERIACAEDLVAEHSHRNLLERLFDRHPESSRTIAVLHLVDNMTLEEVATEVKMSVSGVRKRLRGLRETLVELEAV
jgi:RNA polymerase sigma-70 factor, ECF subfamily